MVDSELGGDREDMLGVNEETILGKVIGNIVGGLIEHILF
jgi:hypothetical protein